MLKQKFIFIDTTQDEEGNYKLIDNDIFKNECELAGIDPTQAVFIFPGNIKHNQDPTVGLYQVKQKGQGFGGLARIAEHLSIAGFATLSLPTTDMPLVKDANRIPSMAQEAIAFLWRVIGFGLHLVMPVRKKGSVIDNQGKKHGTNEYFDSDWNGYEPSLWGGIQSSSNKLLAEYYFKHLNTLITFLEEGGNPPEEFVVAYHEGRAARKALDAGEEPDAWFRLQPQEVFLENENSFETIVLETDEKISCHKKENASVEANDEQILRHNKLAEVEVDKLERELFLEVAKADLKKMQKTMRIVLNPVVLNPIAKSFARAFPKMGKTISNTGRSVGLYDLTPRVKILEELTQAINSQDSYQVALFYRNWNNQLIQNNVITNVDKVKNIILQTYKTHQRYIEKCLHSNEVEEPNSHVSYDDKERNVEDTTQNSESIDEVLIHENKEAFESKTNSTEILFSDLEDIQKACKRGNLDEVQELIRANAHDSNERGSCADSPLIMSLYREDTAMVKWLLKYGESEFLKWEIPSLCQWHDYHIDKTLLFYRCYYSSYQEVIQYILRSLRSNLSHLDSSNKQVLLFLELALYSNKSLRDILKQMNEPLIETFKKSHYIYLFANLKTELFETEGWKLCVEKIKMYPEKTDYLNELEHYKDYTEYSHRYQENIHLYLDNAITLVVSEWAKVLPKEQHSAPTTSLLQQLEIDREFHLKKLSSDVAGEEKAAKIIAEQARVRKYWQFPLAEFITLIEFSQTFKVDELLQKAESSKNTAKDSWKRTFLATVISPTAPYFDLALDKFNLDTAKQLLGMAYGRLRIFDCFSKGIFDWRSLADLNEIFEAKRVLEEFLEPFFIKQDNVEQKDVKENDALTINYEALVIHLLKDRNLLAFLKDDKYKLAREHLIKVCVGASIPGLNEQAVADGLDLIARVLDLVQNSGIDLSEIINYQSLQSLILNLVDKNFLETLDIVKRAIDFIEQLKNVVAIFLKPQLVPMPQLLQPSLQQALNDTHELNQKLNLNPDVKENAIVRAKPLAPKQPFINIDSLLEEAITKENLGNFLRTPIGNSLANKEWKDCVFLGSNAHTDNEGQLVVVQGSFERIIFENYDFSGCCFQNFSFAHACFFNCNFSDAAFIEEIDLTGAVVDAKTAFSLLEALTQSRLNLKDNIKGKMILAGPGPTADDETKILDIDDDLVEHVDFSTNKISWVRLNQVDKDAAESYAPIFSQTSVFTQDTDIPLSEADTTSEEHVEQKDTSSTSWFGGLSGILSFEALKGVGQQAAQTFYDCVFQPGLIIDEESDEPDKIISDPEEIKSQAQENKEKIEEALEKLQKEFDEVKSLNDQHTKAMDFTYQEQEKLKEQLEDYDTAIAILKDKMAEIEIYWQEKKAIAQQQQYLLKHSNAAVKIFYQTLLTQLSGSFLVIFLLQNHLNLINPPGDKLTDLANRGGALSKTKAGKKLEKAKMQSQLGFLSKAVEDAPEAITQAFNILERSTGYILSTSKRLLKFKAAAKMIPKAGDIVAGCLDVVEVGVDFVIDKNEQQKLQSIERVWQNATPRNLEQLADSIARKVTYAYLQPICLLTEESAKIAGICGMRRVIVALLNQHINTNENLILEILVAMRSFNVSQNNYGGLPNPFEIKWIKRPLVLADQNNKNKITEDDIYRRSGICYEGNDGGIHFYRNKEDTMDRAQEVGYMEILEEEWERYFIDDVMPELDNQSRFLTSSESVNIDRKQGVAAQVTKEQPPMPVSSIAPDLSESQKLKQKNRELKNQLSEMTKKMNALEERINIQQSNFDELLKQLRLANATPSSGNYHEGTRKKVIESETRRRLSTNQFHKHQAEPKPKSEKVDKQPSEATRSQAKPQLFNTTMPQARGEQLRYRSQPTKATPPTVTNSSKSNSKDNRPAKDYGINEALEYYLKDIAHVIHPRLCSVSTPLHAGDPENAHRGIINYLEAIAGYEENEIFHGGFLHKDGAEFKKPIVMIINTLPVKPEDGNAKGGSHWITCVILPKQYTVLGQTIPTTPNSTERIFFIDSYFERSCLPKEFKEGFEKGIPPYEVSREPSKEDVLKNPTLEGKSISSHRAISAPFHKPEFTNCNIPQQKLGSSDCGWWAFYNTIMLISKGDDSFKERFKQRQDALALRKLLPGLTLWDGETNQYPIAKGVSSFAELVEKFDNLFIEPHLTSSNTSCEPIHLSEVAAKIGHFKESQSANDTQTPTNASQKNSRPREPSHN